MAYNPRDFVLAISSLCPGLAVNVDFECYDPGSGPQISVWNSKTIEQPTLAQIQAVDTEALFAAASAPSSVSPRQARLALSAAGLLDRVNAAVNQAGGSTLITWEYASVISRSDPLIATLGASLNLTNAQIDALFVTASTL